MGQLGPCHPRGTPGLSPLLLAFSVLSQAFGKSLSVFVSLPFK